MFKTELCRLLGIEYPIIQGGMAWVSDAHLAAAVSDAGGLGVVAAGHILDPEILRKEIRRVKEITSQPFGVNLMLMNPMVPKLVEVIVEEGVTAVTTGAGNPGRYIPILREAGVKVMPVVASVALARRVEREGADAVIVEGTEAGGHVGELTTMVLVPQVVDAVSIPVVAAGGVADGRGFLAALALGAKGVQMGTRFAASTECRVHDNWKKIYVKAKDRDTVVTGRPTGHPVRVIKNKLAREFLKLEQEGAPMEVYDRLGSGGLRKAALEGDVQGGSVMAGQIVGLIKEIKPVREIIQDVLTQAREELERLQAMAEVEV